MRAVRHETGRIILLFLFLLPALLAWLAERAGMGWELVTLGGVLVALGVAGALRDRRRGRATILAVGLATGCVLMLGAGHGVLPPWLATTLPFAALAIAALLCDMRALGVSVLVLLVPMAPRLPESAWEAAGLVALAGLGWLAQGIALRTLAGPRVVLMPARAAAAPVWTRPAEAFARPGLLVQAERTPDGAVRLAVAGAASGRLRVSVR